MNRPRLYVVALSHLDTQWRWTVRDTVERFLPATVEANERLFDRFPAYVLSFEGSYRYQLLAEHHPALFARVRERAARRSWHPAGAAVEAFDTLLPAPESIVRQILHGRRWFRRELGVDSRDLFLPDCFGFPATLPTLARHLGLIGFSTQKLRRGALMRSAFGIPFAFGRWRGPDGAELLAALDPGEYSGRVTGDLTRDAEHLAGLRALAAAGVPARRLLYVGIGDRGGAVPADSIARLSAALTGDGPIEVRHGPSERLFADTDASEYAALPAYTGELLLSLHGTGCYSAKAILKRWNRRVEQLARVAETAVAAALAAGRPAPRRRLEAAWQLLLAHQMHDDLTGTAIPAAYRYTLADFGLAANELGEIALDALSSAAEELDLGGGAAHLVALTTLAQAHAAIVEVAGLPADAVAVEDAAGELRPIQRLEPGEGAPRALVPVLAQGAGLQRLTLRATAPPPRAAGAPAEAGEDWLENGRYRLELAAGGALASLVDKRLGRELLSAPAALELLPDRSAKYPAWEIRWEDISAEPLGHVDRRPRVRVAERGPLRAALRVERRAAGIVVRETWSLAAGDAGDLVGAEVEIEWRRRARLLKAAFHLAAENDHASYDTGLGAVARPIASRRLHEVPAQQWAAIEDRGGAFGVALFADGRHGWDQPAAGTLRATWLHAPRASVKWRHQATQDFGLHRFRFALAGLAGGAVADGTVAALADRFIHRPRLYFVDEPSRGRAARRDLLQVAWPARLLALKPAEDDDSLVVRVSNPTARPLAAAIASPLDELSHLVPCDGMEAPFAPPAGAATELVLPPSGLASLRGAPRPRRALPAGDARWRPLALPWELAGASANGERGRGAGFDGRGSFLPLELLPARLDDVAVPFDLDHARARRGDHLAARGQEVELPADAVEVWLLAAAVGGELEASFEIGGQALAVKVPDWRSPLLRESRWRGAPFVRRLEPGRFLRRPSAWSCGHLHDRAGRDLAVERAVLFALRLPARGAGRLRLPGLPSVRVLAATVATSVARRLREAEPPDLP